MSPRPLLRVAALALALVLAAPAVAGAFGDVDADRYYARPVAWLVDEGITTGVEPGCFGPHDAISRGQVAAFLYRLDTARGGSALELQDAADHPFADLSASWQEDPVTWLFDEGLTTGVGPRTFAPDDAITRGEFAVFLWRYAGRPDAPAHPFTDVGEPWQNEAVAWMASAGVTTGTSPSTFHPEARMTRAQAATFLWRHAGQPAADLAVIDTAAYCDRGTRLALTYAGLTAGEAACAAPFLARFSVDELRLTLEDPGRATMELATALADIHAAGCVSPERTAELIRTWF